MSDVWNYFQKIKNDDNIIISINCQLCKAEYSAITSTSTLRRHLRNLHSSVYIQEDNQLEPNSSYTFAEQKHITVKLIQWIIVDLQPFNVVEQTEFQEFVHSLDSRYVLPCRQTIKEEVNLLFL